MTKVTDPKEAIAIAVEKLDAAHKAVAAAEAQLDQLLAELRAAPRAEKTAVSAGLERALATLRVARTNTTDAEEVLASAKR